MLHWHVVRLHVCIAYMLHLVCSVACLRVICVLYAGYCAIHVAFSKSVVCAGTVFVTATQLLG
jgi:hypothetical protein